MLSVLSCAPAPLTALRIDELAGMAVCSVPLSFVGLFGRTLRQLMLDGVSIEQLPGAAVALMSTCRLQGDSSGWTRTRPAAVDAV